MSNPYGGPPGPEPGEPSAYAPYGASPYGAPSSYRSTTGTDPVSITGFVLSLLCCTSVAGLILGIIGLRRTKNGVRKGRWAAVSAVSIGAVGTLACVGLIGFFTWFGTSTVLLESADVGQCVNVDEFSSSHDATLFKKDCEEAHEAEVVVTDEFDDDLLRSYDDNSNSDFCATLLSEDYAAAYDSGGYDLGLVFEASDPDEGDAFICYLERADGDDLDRQIGD